MSGKAKPVMTEKFSKTKFPIPHLRNMMARLHQENAGAQHHRAMVAPVDGFELPFLMIAEALAEYADAHRSRYESEIGEDGVLGDHFSEIARGLLGLLNGETGRLDCGTLDGAIRQLCKNAKVEGIEQ